MVDDLGMSWENFPVVKTALRKFVEEGRRPNDLVAILSTGGGMGIFQQFITDPKQQLAAIDLLKHNVIFSRVGPEILKIHPSDDRISHFFISSDKMCRTT